MGKPVKYYDSVEFADSVGVTKQAIYKAYREGRVIKDGINPNYGKNKAYTERFLKGKQFKFPRHVKGKFLNPSMFADILGITRQAVYKAVKAGTVVAHGINPDLPRNKEFAATAKTNSGNKKEVKFAKAVGKAQEDENEKEKPAENSGKNELSDYEEKTVRAYSEGKNAKVEYQNYKTKEVQLRIAKEMKELIPRELVEKFFGRVVGVLHTSFLYFGERTAAHIAGICEITEPAKKLDIQKVIDKEITGGLKELKSQAEAFARSIREDI